MNPLSLFKCLSDETRLKSMLLIAQLGELCVCDLVDALQLSQPKVSRHLAELRGCDLLIGNRRGKWVYYKLPPQLPEWVNTLLQTTVHNNPHFIQTELAAINQTAKCCN